MTLIHAGATVERPPGAKYAKALTFAELVFSSSWPRPGKLAGWRKSIGPELRCALVAPHGALHGERGVLRWDDDLEERFQWYLDALDAAQGDAVVSTGRDLSTSQKDRTRLKELFERIPRPEGRRVVWAPAGIWTWEEAYPFSEKLGVTCAFDPLQEEMGPPGDVAYVRLKTIGGRQRFSEGILYELLETLEAYEEAYVALESPRSFDEAVRLRKMALEF